MAKNKSNEYTAEQIVVLKGLEPVRVRPGMYIGNTGRSGLNHLVQEMIDNAVDEHLAGACDEIYVSINKDGSATVSDNGRGIPVDMHKTEKIPAERAIYTILHSGGKFNNTAYKISGGLHGVGGAVVNALSKRLVIDICRDGYMHHDEYEYGVPVVDLVNGLLPKTKLKEKRTGTTVTLYPDETIFETVKFKANAIQQRLKETAYLNPNLTIIFHNKRDDKEPVTYHQPGGLNAFIEDVAEGLTFTSPVIELHGVYNTPDKEDVVEADIVFVMTEDGEDNYYGFTNNISNPDGGTHITGFKTGVARLVNSYARNELGVLKEKDKNLTAAEILSGIQAIVSVKHPDPSFEGQTKTKLSNTEVSKAIEDIIKEQLTVYFDRNYEVLKNIVDRAVAISKKKNVSKIKTDFDKFSCEASGKLVEQESKNPEDCEIYIVEGDSAGGSAKNARNRKYQAVLPLRGKILNVEKATLEKILGNAEIQTMIAAFGTGINDSFDINKLKYHKIIIMTDADVDGSHIAVLMLTFFYRFMPDLIKEGYVYLATPPLYRVDDGKSKTYLYSDKELEKYRKSHKGNFKTQRFKGLGEMDSDQLYDTTMDPEKRILKRVTIESLVEANKLTSILMGNDVSVRKDYIMEHGGEAVIDN